LSHTLQKIQKSSPNLAAKNLAARSSPNQQERVTHFMKKVVKILGKTVAVNFNAFYIHPQNGQSYALNLKINVK
jgi:hypothetical protein